MLVGQSRKGDAHPAAQIVGQHIEGIGAALAAGNPAIECAHSSGVNREKSGADTHQASHDSADGRRQENQHGQAQQDGAADHRHTAAEAVAGAARKRPHKDADDVGQIEQRGLLGRKSERCFRQTERQIVKDRREDRKAGGGACTNTQQRCAAQQRRESDGIDRRLGGEPAAWEEGDRENRGGQNEDGGGHESETPAEIDLNTPTQQPPAQAPEYGG